MTNSDFPPLSVTSSLEDDARHTAISSPARRSNRNYLNFSLSAVNPPTWFVFVSLSSHLHHFYLVRHSRRGATRVQVAKEGRIPLQRFADPRVTGDSNTGRRGSRLKNEHAASFESNAGRQLSDFFMLRHVVRNTGDIRVLCLSSHVSVSSPNFRSNFRLRIEIEYLTRI